MQTAEGVTLSGYAFGNAGVEPAVIGTAFATEAGQLSQPVDGNTGVFVLVPGQKNVSENTFNEETEKAQLASRYAYLPYQIINAIEEKANVVDNRSNFQ